MGEKEARTLRSRVGLDANGFLGGAFGCTTRLAGGAGANGVAVTFGTTSGTSVLDDTASGSSSSLPELHSSDVGFGSAGSGNFWTSGVGSGVGFGFGG